MLDPAIPDLSCAGTLDGTAYWHRKFQNAASISARNGPSRCNRCDRDGRRAICSRRAVGAFLSGVSFFGGSPPWCARQTSDQAFTNWLSGRCNDETGRRRDRTAFSVVSIRYGARARKGDGTFCRRCSAAMTNPLRHAPTPPGTHPRLASEHVRSFCAAKSGDELFAGYLSAIAMRGTSSAQATDQCHWATWAA